MVNLVEEATKIMQDKYGDEDHPFGAGDHDDLYAEVYSAIEEAANKNDIQLDDFDDSTIEDLKQKVGKNFLDL